MDKSMDFKRKNFSLRYSNAGILIILIFLSFLSVILSLFFQNSKYLTNYNSNNLFYNTFPSAIYNSLYDVNNRFYENYDYDTDSSVKFIIRSMKIDNLENTEEFKKRYPDEVTVRDREDNIIFRGTKDAFEEQKDDYTDRHLYKISTKDTPVEEPREKIAFLTNYADLNINTNPQDFAVPNNKNIYAVKGFYENGKLTITSQQQADEKYDKYVESFNRSLKIIYKDINYKYYGIEKLNFMYLVDFSSKQFQNELNKSHWELVLLPASVAAIGVSIILTIFFVMISNYDKLKKISFVEAIKRFPIEIVITLSCLWVLPIIFLVEEGGYLLEASEILIYGFMFIMVFLALIAVYYYGVCLKSIYWEGGKSFVWQNSVIVKIIKSIIIFLKNITKKIAKSFQENSDITTNALNKCRMVYAGFTILGIFGASLVNTSLKIIVFILWMIMISVIYFVCKRYFIDLNNMNNISKKIAEGDYNNHIDESETFFKGIAHSFNTISDNLNSAINEAVKSERMKTELITNVSHDLKTPLTSIINYSDLIVNENTTNEEKDEYAKVIYEKSIKLKHLIEDLFEVSKASSGNIDLDLEDIDFRAIIMQIAGEWEDKFEEKNLTIIERLPEEQVILNLDGNKTSRVLDNLFSNIYKYAMPNTRVYVDLFTKNNKVIFTIKNISNYSLNISPEELIDRFTRGDESRNTEGSGLGLSIASSLVEAQKGKFSIEIDGDLFKTEIEF